MDVEALPILGAWVTTPTIHGDDRGHFAEWFRDDVFTTQAGAPFELRQANCSVSRAGVVRGVHYATIPQAKYVMCAAGKILDVVVDLRVGSPSFGQWHGVELDAVGKRAVYLPGGLGHGFSVLSDEATVVYLCSEPYTPDREHTINPLDRELAIDWQAADPLLSPRDAAGPSFATAQASGPLPTWQ